MLTSSFVVRIAMLNNGIVANIDRYAMRRILKGLRE